MNLCKNTHIALVEDAISSIAISSPQNKETLRKRYISLLHHYRWRVVRYSYSYHILRIIITVGSLIVPALLSVQTSGSTQIFVTQDTIYWIVWTLSLLVTISNGIMTLLKVDKKYFTLNTTYQQLLSEGWQYIHLCNKYDGHKTGGQASHETQFRYFTHNLEKIRMKQIEEEYYKILESSGHSSKQELFSANTPFPQSAAARNSMHQVNAGSSSSRPTTVPRQNETTSERPSTPSSDDEQDFTSLPMPGHLPESSSRR